MLLRKHLAPEAPAPIAHREYQQVASEALAVLARLAQARVDYVLVGAVAESILTRAAVPGPVTIVPAPYRRNLERLTRERGLMAEAGLTLETQLELSRRYQELLYETRAHLVADGVRVEVAAAGDLRRSPEIRASRGTPAAAPLSVVS